MPDTEQNQEHKSYPVEFSEHFDIVLKKLKKKDFSLALRLLEAIKEICKNPEHYKPLRNILKGKRRKHIGHFVLVFSFENGIVRMENFAHHDDVY
ncbi:MAG: type II toxin-antitoxin system mRNA interferase toxin, RelE/StbE family [Nanoarchaeota archaeon]|nr:type II toxin-antitoxin system mRNA interferase toxin, RelE/StbE family [Nanoarchaeota archaeon]